MTLYERGAVWYYDFRLDGRRHVKRVGPDKAVAKEAERVARQRAHADRYRDEWDIRPAGRAKRIRLADFLATLLREEFEPKKETHRVVWSVFRVIGRELGHHVLGAITPAMLVTYRDARLAKVSVNQVHREFYWIRRALRTAQRRDLLRKNPALEVKLPRREPPPDRILEEDEDVKLLDAFIPKKNGTAPIAWIHDARLRARDMVALDLFTALRRDEICQLRKGHVDLRRRQIVYRQPKTQSVKTIPLVDDAVSILSRYVKRGDDPEAFVFLNRLGRPYKPGSLWCAFRDARARAKLRGRRVRLHDLRHTVAVRLLRGDPARGIPGADLATVGDILGHTPPYITTMRYLAHVSSTRKVEAMRTLQKSQRR